MARRGQELIYWDACVFLAYINGENGRIRVLDDVLEEIENGSNNRKVVTSAFSKSEVAYATTEKETKTLDPNVEDAIDALWNDDSVILVVEYHDSISTLARQLMRDGITRGWALKPPDATHLASAKWVGAIEFHTYDIARLKKYEQLIGMPIREPYVLQPRLGGM